MVSEKRQQSTNKKRNGGTNFNLSSIATGTPEKTNLKGILNALNQST